MTEDTTTAACRGDGKPIEPGDGIVPILEEVERGKLKIVGTGFYVTRYGLLVSAKHVLEELIDLDQESVKPSFVLHLAPENGLYLRRVCRVHLLKKADLGAAQVDNFLERFPTDPLVNLRAVLSTEQPVEGGTLTTFGYPENGPLDLTVQSALPIVKCDYFMGGFLRYVEDSQHPYMRYPHFETSIGF